jgi:uncharacterized membrane protein
MKTLLQPTDHAALWALMTAGTGVAIWLEQRYRWAARLSGPVLALLLAMLLANCRLMPTAAPAYDLTSQWLVPLAIPLLLIRANLRDIVRTSGRLFVVFHLSSLGTVLGTLLAVRVLSGAVARTDLHQAAGLMAASYTGGAVNFSAVQASYHVPVRVANPLIVADNFVMAGMFVWLLGLGASPRLARWWASGPVAQAQVQSPQATVQPTPGHWPRKAIGLLDLAQALAFGFGVLGLAELAGRGLGLFWAGSKPEGLALQMVQTLLTNRFVLITGITLLVATMAAGPLARINGAEELGTYLLLLFLFTLGLPADLVGVLRDAPLFFVFCGLIAVVNLAVTLGAGWLLRWDLPELLLAVNATLGGAPSAAAMAVSAGWGRLVLPGVLVGIWGYVIGTPIGILMLEWLRRA